VVHQPAKDAPASTALAPGVRAVPWRQFIDELNRR
jgi:hypothetical protein